MVTFAKPATSVARQIRTLTDRGLIIDNVDEAKRWLSTVSYYRLGAYWLTLETPPAPGQQRSRKFVEGATFEQATDLYLQDRRLRLLIMEAIDRIEISVRTQWTLKMVGQGGSHAQLVPNMFINPYYYTEAIARLRADVERSSELYIAHYLRTYDDPPLPPLWMATELMSFGDLSKWVDNTKSAQILKLVAKAQGLPNPESLKAVLQALVVVRNYCAHHARLWNRRLVKRPPLITKLRDDMVVDLAGGPDNRLYNILVVLLMMLKHQSPDTTYCERLNVLLAKYSPAQLSVMGFPTDWKSKLLGSVQSEQR